jgi:hypothetical protein
MVSNSGFPAQASKKRKVPSWETIQGLIEAVPEEADPEELKTFVSTLKSLLGELNKKRKAQEASYKQNIECLLLYHTNRRR